MEVIIAGLAGGAAWAVIGTVRNMTKADKDDENDFKFKPKKFLKSVFVGAGIGAYLASQNAEVSIATIDGFLTSQAGLVPIVGVAEKLASVVYDGARRIFTKFFNY